MYSKIANSYLPSEIQGENGSIIIEKLNNFSKVKIIYRDNTVEDIGVDQFENDMYYEIEEFIRLVENSHSEAIYSSVNTLDNTLNTMAVMDKIRNQLGIVFPADNKYSK